MKEYLLSLIETIEAIEQEFRICSDNSFTDIEKMNLYIGAKNHITDICGCFDFLNFSILIHTEGMKIKAAESLLAKEELSRLLNALTGCDDPEQLNRFMERSFSHSFHTDCTCEDINDRREIFLRKVTNLEKLKVLRFTEKGKSLSFSETRKIISELHSIMDSMSIDRRNIPESTSEAVRKASEQKQTFILYCCCDCCFCGNAQSSAEVKQYPLQ